MKIARKVTASLIMALLLCALWSSPSSSRDRSRSARSTAGKTMQDPSAQSGQQAQRAAMSDEEKLVRDLYARLMRYQSAATDELAAREGKATGPDDYLTFELRDIRSGSVSEISGRPLNELITEGSGTLINLKTTHLNQGDGPVHAYYEAEWSGVSSVENPSDAGLSKSATGARTVGQLLRKGGENFKGINRYTSYEVRVQLKGQQRTYRALALYQLDNPAQDSSRVMQPERARAAHVQILDNITTDLSAIYSEESPAVRSPWQKYVKTGTYIAVARSIKETKQAGKALIPVDAPIGYLPGDDVAPSNEDRQTMAVNAMCNAGVAKIQYQSDSGFVDISGTLYVFKGTSVTFKAIPDPADGTFASGQPVWSGTSGATGTGETTSVTFNTASTSTSDFKTVIATAGNSVTVNVIVYNLTGVLTARDNFTGRSNTDFGVAEVVDLSFTATPAVTAAQAGGLQWKQTTGSGTLTGMTDGTGTYTAASSPESVTLKLEVQAGPSKGLGPSTNINVIAPSGAYQVQQPGSGVAHAQGTCSAGFHAITYLTPKTVSFINIEAREGTTSAAATGWLARDNGVTHPVGSWLPVANCDISTGCQIQAIDSIYNQYPPNYGGPMWGNGDFQWNIPREWRVGTGSATQYTSLLHHFISDAAGKATISKGGAGPFSKNANDPNSSF
ncbi:MAG: hypothetical protein WBP93_16870 [Pyrinomonadaceae bacterium]